MLKEHESPYACFANNPIWFRDKYGAVTSFADPHVAETFNDTYDKTAKKWVGNSSGTPILVDVSEFSSTAKKVLTNNRINY